MMPFIVMDTKGGIILMKMHRGNFTLWESRLVDCVHYNRIMRSCYSVHVYSALKQGINGPEFIFWIKCVERLRKFRDSNREAWGAMQTKPASFQVSDCFKCKDFQRWVWLGLEAGRGGTVVTASLWFKQEIRDTLKILQFAQMEVPHTISWRINLIGFGVRLVSFLLETFPGLSGRWWPPDSPVTLLAQNLISSGVLFIMINGNANDGEVLSHQRWISLIPSRCWIYHCHPHACLRGAHGCRPGRLPEHRQAGLGRVFLPICFYSSFAEYLFGNQSSNIFPAEMITILGQ